MVKSPLVIARKSVGANYAARFSEKIGVPVSTLYKIERGVIRQIPAEYIAGLLRYGYDPKAVEQLLIDQESWLASRA